MYSEYVVKIFLMLLVHGRGVRCIGGMLVSIHRVVSDIFKSESLGNIYTKVTKSDTQ